MNKENKQIKEYTQQCGYVMKIVELYEKVDGEPSEEDGLKIMELLTQMQALGNPPQSIMQSFEGGNEMGDMPSECPQM